MALLIPFILRHTFRSTELPENRQLSILLYWFWLRLPLFTVASPKRERNYTTDIRTSSP